VPGDHTLRVGPTLSFPSSVRISTQRKAGPHAPQVCCQEVLDQIPGHDPAGTIGPVLVQAQNQGRRVRTGRMSGVHLVWHPSMSAFRHKTVSLHEGTQPGWWTWESCTSMPPGGTVHEEHSSLVEMSQPLWWRRTLPGQNQQRGAQACHAHSMRMHGRLAQTQRICNAESLHWHSRQKPCALSCAAFSLAPWGCR